jgi:cold shock CspA family protein|uniref:CSD domain-containing protein n=1 Tax=viral metagenome TaxID=1070528 RepID=A0A6C0JAL8_9ZZZZ
MAEQSKDVTYEESQFYIGCVKWFNNKKGYGYVTVKEGPLVNIDIFTHHSSIQKNEMKYGYLVTGEYVHIKVQDSHENGHAYQANAVKAPCDDGKLMCEQPTIRRRTGDNESPQ